MRNITTVVFDLGRVLLDLRSDGEAFGELMRAMGIEPEEAFSRFWMRNEVARHSTGLLTSREFYQAAKEEYGLEMDFDRFAECWCDIFSPKPEMEALFEEVAGRHRVGILSDTDPLHWARIRGMLPCLKAVERPTLSFEVGYFKPHPTMYAAAARNAGSALEECLFIDDLVGNVDGARHSGMQAVRFAGVERLRRDLGFFGIL